MNLAILIPLSILAYALVGSVVAGFGIRYGWGRDAAFAAGTLWPVVVGFFVVAGIAAVLVLPATAIAFKVSGEDDVWHNAIKAWREWGQ